ncbi:hypothetical protein SK069_08515 [Patulibacter brassicae]|uniref:PH domain-containing protein n=1 Tax=Patulibacter brassicae TaxID=1705717 RepID=A0ABU4VIG0_9ACTN|nr:hypothetical protein [Patulibacter brassicae]MDX8151631.1 hypothetical protein [Patulibacter brassicae]
MPNDQQYLTAAEAVVPGPVVACGPCTRTKGLSALALGQVSGAAGAIQRHRGKRAAQGLPDMFLLAVTSDRLYALSQPKVRWSRTPKATGVLLELDRATAVVATAPARFGTKVTITGAGLEGSLELQTAGRADALLDALAGTVRA